MDSFLAWRAMLAVLVLAASSANAQSLDSAFGVVPVPPGNPQTASKVALGKALFWDEQLSVTGTVACGTCHRPEAGGADPRSSPANPGSIHPGPDATRGTSDDSIGSMGVPMHDADGRRLWSPQFGFAPQVTPRAARTVVNSAFEAALLWDGAESGSFSDPETGTMLIASGAALEAQVLRPLLNPIEMGSTSADLGQLASRIRTLKPLALADSIPSPLETWIAGRDYDALFQETFGGEVTAARIAMAIASYERSLVADRTPFDLHRNGELEFTSLQLDGMALFNAMSCQACHELLPKPEAPGFQFTGVRPAQEDAGRFALTADPADIGRMQTPSIRNLTLRKSFFHNGRATTMAEVFDFYVRGGDFGAPNKDPRVKPQLLFADGGEAMTAFLETLTDARLAAASGPFTRPTLFSESARVPRIVGNGRTAFGFTPRLGAIEPPLLGSRFTLTVEAGAPGQSAKLAISRGLDQGAGLQGSSGDFANIDLLLDNAGNASVDLVLPSNADLDGIVISGRVYVGDGSVTPAFEAVLFSGARTRIFGAGFEQ